MEEVTDADLFESLERMLPQAKLCISHIKQQEMYGVWLEQKQPSLADLAKFLGEMLSKHQIFKTSKSIFFEIKQLILGPHFQSVNMLLYAERHGSKAAIDWLKYIYSIEAADILYVAETYGIELEHPILFGNGVSIQDLVSIPDSRNKKRSLRQFDFGPNDGFRHVRSRPVAASLTIRGVKGTSDPTTIKSPRSKTLEDTVLALTLIKDASPVIAWSWIDFCDPEIAAAEYGLLAAMPFFEGSMPTDTVKISSKDEKWIERYLSIDMTQKAVCDLAIGRLNLARRRHKPGDQAIDGAICLEALLGEDNTQGEITYRLRLRSSLLLGESLKARRKISNAIKDFYNLRSLTVHGSNTASKKNKKPDTAIAEEGLSICADVLRKFVEHGQKINTEELELSDPQSRTSEAMERFFLGE